MKEYMKPEVEFVDFMTEEIADVSMGPQGGVDVPGIPD